MSEIDFEVWMFFSIIPIASILILSTFIPEWLRPAVVFGVGVGGIVFTGIVCYFASRPEEGGLKP